MGSRRFLADPVKSAPMSASISYSIRCGNEYQFIKTVRHNVYFSLFQGIKEDLGWPVKLQQSHKASSLEAWTNVNV